MKEQNEQRPALLECGRIVAAHGVRGAVKVEPWCDGAAVLAGFSRVYLMEKDGYAAHEVCGAFVHGGRAVLTLSGVENMDAALALKGKTLYVAREEIPVPAGAMLQADMIGLPVKDADTGVTYGTLIRIDPSPAAELYVVSTPRGEVLLPAVPAFIKEVNPTDGIMVTPIPGFFNDI